MPCGSTELDRDLPGSQLRRTLPLDGLGLLLPGDAGRVLTGVDAMRVPLVLVLADGGWAEMLRPRGSALGDPVRRGSPG